jgi:hypothetical protein
MFQILHRSSAMRACLNSMATRGVTLRSTILSQRAMSVLSCSRSRLQNPDKPSTPTQNDTASTVNASNANAHTDQSGSVSYGGEGMSQPIPPARGLFAKAKLNFDRDGKRNWGLIVLSATSFVLSLRLFYNRGEHEEEVDRLRRRIKQLETSLRQHEQDASSTSVGTSGASSSVGLASSSSAATSESANAAPSRTKSAGMCMHGCICVDGLYLLCVTLVCTISSCIHSTLSNHDLSSTISMRVSVSCYTPHSSICLIPPSCLSIFLFLYSVFVLFGTCFAIHPRTMAKTTTAVRSSVCHRHPPPGSTLTY